MTDRKELRVPSGTAATAVTDAWAVGDAYEQYIGRWSREVAPRFLDWLAAPAGLHWADIGCGTGALCEAISHRARPASITGIDPSPGFLAVAQRRLDETGRLAGSVHLQEGNATTIPIADSSIDRTVSALALNFVPDPSRALADFHRHRDPLHELRRLPAPAYAMSLSEDMRMRLREALRRRIAFEADGSIAFAARAWAVRGRR